jgi:phosphotransferase system  glucose/maltose/N-acetylglucosamine-specific IIC component
VRGEIARFIAGDPAAGHMTGLSVQNVGSAGAAAAITLAARRRTGQDSGIMMSAALTAF